VSIAERSIQVNDPRSSIPRLHEAYDSIACCERPEMVERPSKNGVFKTLSRATIVAGKSLPDIYDKRITFGSYALVYMYWHQKQYEEE